MVLENLGGFVMNIHVKHGCGSGMYDLKHTVFFHFAIHTECSLYNVKSGVTRFYKS